VKSIVEGRGTRLTNSPDQKFLVVRPSGSFLCKEENDHISSIPGFGGDGEWCGVVWCGVVWCGVVWCGVVWCGVVWCGAV